MFIKLTLTFLVQPHLCLYLWLTLAGCADYCKRLLFVHAPGLRHIVDAFFFVLYDDAI